MVDKLIGTDMQELTAQCLTIIISSQYFKKSYKRA